MNLNKSNYLISFKNSRIFMEKIGSKQNTQKHERPNIIWVVELKTRKIIPVILSLFFFFSLVGPRSTRNVQAIELKQFDGPPHSDFNVTINSTKGMYNFTGLEFMALPNVTGWSTLGGEAKMKWKGVNFTWFAETYGVWGPNLTAEFKALDGFTSNMDFEDVINNATHTYILAYEFDDRLLDDLGQVWILPITLEESGNILWTGQAHPRMVTFINIIGSELSALLDLQRLLFAITFAGVASAVGVLVLLVGVYLDRRKEK